MLDDPAGCLRPRLVLRDASPTGAKRPAGTMTEKVAAGLNPQPVTCFFVFQSEVWSLIHLLLLSGWTDSSIKTNSF